jgi:hypothetical protein
MNGDKINFVNSSLSHVNPQALANRLNHFLLFFTSWHVLFSPYQPEKGTGTCLTLCLAANTVPVTE